MAPRASTLPTAISASTSSAPSTKRFSTTRPWSRATRRLGVVDRESTCGSSAGPERARTRGRSTRRCRSRGISSRGRSGHWSPGERRRRFSSWQGWFVPANTPREVVTAIHQGAKTALSAPDVLERVRLAGNEAVASTPAEFEQRFKADLVKFAKIVKEAHIPVQD